MLRKNGESSTSSTDCVCASVAISFRMNQSAKAIGRKWPTSMTSVAWPLITAEPRMPSLAPETWMWSRSSTMSMISSTTRPIARVSSANTRIGRDLLQPRDERQRHRLGLRRAGAEHQERGELLAANSMMRRMLVGDRLRGRAGGAERLGDAVRVDDHDDRAVAQDGVAREHVDVPQLGRHRLDHDFLGMEHAVHHDAEGLVADLRHYNEAVLRIGRRAVIDLQELLQMHQRQEIGRA